MPSDIYTDKILCFSPPSGSEDKLEFHVPVFVRLSIRLLNDGTLSIETKCIGIIQLNIASLKLGQYEYYYLLITLLQFLFCMYCTLPKIKTFVPKMRMLAYYIICTLK